VGDGATSANGQNTATLLGKILRIDPRQSGSLAYTIPATNPFRRLRGQQGDLGLRPAQPWRISFDRANGDLWIGDVGASTWEEVDHEPSGSAATTTGGPDGRQPRHTAR